MMERSFSPCKSYCFYLFISACFFFNHSTASSLPIGIHPLDEKYYTSEVIKCKDGSKTFSRDRINDNFCDCPDGTDEPGTSACPRGKFYCRNVGSTPQFLFSSRVNDRFCDCCDGSDEYDGSVICPNTCVMGGNVAYIAVNYGSKISDLNGAKATKEGASLEESNWKLKGLKVVVILQVVLIVFVSAFLIFRMRIRPRRRHLHRISLA